MAIYHLSTKPISRSSGRSAVASIAYRAGIKIEDERLGKIYDYTKRSGVLHTEMITPNGEVIERSKLWNLAEATEKRSNSRTAREIVINIPFELMKHDNASKNLVSDFAKHLSKKYQVAVDIAIHSADKKGDERNYHAHLLLTTRKIEQTKSGIKLGDKSQLEMSNAQLKKLGLLSNQDELKEIRKTWAEMANNYLLKFGIDERIDHRSHKDRGLETLPTKKLGWHATQLERMGIKTEIGNYNRSIQEYNLSLTNKQQLLELQQNKNSLENFRQKMKSRKIEQEQTTTEQKTKTSDLLKQKIEAQKQHNQSKKFDEKLNEQSQDKQIKASKPKFRP